ncbi:MAG: PTS transporter subunit EIIC [Cyanobacteria bacterium P01_D01_bin.56]
MLRDFAKYRLFLIIREAFTSLLPIVLAMNILVLLSNLTWPVEFFGFEYTLINTSEINRLYFFLIPLFFNLSLSSLLAKEKELDHIGTILVCMVCFFRASGFLGINEASEITSSNGSIISSLLLSLITVGGLSFFARFRILRLFKTSRNISPRLRKTFNLALPSLLTILSTEIIKHIIGLYLHSNSVENLISWLPCLNNFSDIQQLILYKTVSLSTWLLGFHGEYTSDGLFQLLQEVPVGQRAGVTFKTFHDVFMNIGGSGSTFVIPFIILLTHHKQHFKSIARLGLFFSLVNVNEILLFGLPIILNPTFFTPFVLAPFINMIIALGAINLGLFDFSLTPVHWMSPPIYNAYIASDGSIFAVIVQLICIASDVLIYYPFLMAFNQQYETSSSLAN